MVVVEELEKPFSKNSDELDRCHSIRTGSRLICQYFLFSELYNSIIVIRKVSVGWRLPFCKQNGLWPKKT
jgi:hypothetical protein